MTSAGQRKTQETETPTLDSFIEETAEAAYLSEPSDEEEANDNFPAHEILLGCIWRDTESAQQRVGLIDDAPFGASRDDARGRQELDFSDDRRGARGLPPEFIEQLEKEYGFDKPPITRFLNMVWNFARFDFGDSYFRSASARPIPAAIRKPAVIRLRIFW